MTSRRSTQGGRPGAPVIPPPPVHPATRPDRRPSIYHDEPSETAPRTRSRADRWTMILAAVALCALAAGVAGWLVLPALDTLSGNSAATWTGEGP